MMLAENFLKRKLAQAQSVLGTWILLPSVEVVDVITSTGIDFIILDCEHSALDLQAVQMAVIAAERNKVSPIVRLPKVNDEEILKFLDLGIHGIQISNIQTKGEAEHLVRATSFENGTRGLSPFTRAGKFSKINLPEHIRTADGNLVRSIIVESTAGIQNIDALLDVPGIDVIYIGLYDLSRSLGVPGEVYSPVVQEKLKLLNMRIKAAGKTLGTISGSVTDIQTYKTMGINFIAHLSDTSMIYNSFVNDVAIFNKY